MSIVRVDSISIASRSWSVTSTSPCLCRSRTFHDVVCGYDVPGLGIDLLEVNAIAGPLIELVKVNFLGLRRGWIKHDWARHERKAQIALPVGAWGHLDVQGRIVGVSNASGNACSERETDHPRGSPLRFSRPDHRRAVRILHLDPVPRRP